MIVTKRLDARTLLISDVKGGFTILRGIKGLRLITWVNEGNGVPVAQDINQL